MSHIETIIHSLELIGYTVVPVVETDEAKQIYTSRDLEQRFQLTSSSGTVTIRSQSELIDLGEKNGWI